MDRFSKVVVFGGSGFLGSHVADELSRSGYDVTLFDLTPSPYLRSDQHMIVGNILDARSVEAACDGCDYIYNFAGLADINEAKDKPELTMQLNVVGNLNILEAARRVRARRFVFASSVYIYSETGSFYRVSKQASEDLIRLYSATYDLRFTILRYGSLYGRRADRRNSIYRFISDALSKREIHYTGTGNELREYIHVLDAAVSSVQILDPVYSDQHIVLTGHQLFRVKDVMRMIAEILPHHVRLLFDNESIGAHYEITPYAYRSLQSVDLKTQSSWTLRRYLTEIIQMRLLDN